MAKLQGWNNGGFICTVGSLCFFLGCLDKIFFSSIPDILVQSIVFVGIGATLLGYRKSKHSTIVLQKTKEDSSEEEYEMLNS